MRFLLEQLPWGLIAVWALACAISLVLARRQLTGRLGTGAALAGGLAVLATHASLYARFTIDDSFITFRYARNWARGLGPVWQAGERVEGYTSLAWTALLALAHRLGFDIETASKVFGVLAAAAALVWTLKLSRASLEGRRLAPLAPLALALQPLFAAWTFSGMEAVLFAALLAGAAVTLAGTESDTPPLSGAIAFGALAWVRPEGPLFAACAFAALFVVAPRRPSLAAAARWFAVCALVVAPIWLWRWSYYHAILPNTFYAKTALSVGSLVRGLTCVGDFAVCWGALGFLFLALAPLRARWQLPLTRFLFLALPAFVLYVVWAGGDVLHLRFFVHVLPLLVVAAMPGFELVLDALRAPLRALRPRALAAVIAAMILVGVTSAYLADGRAFATLDQFGPAYVVSNSRNVQRADVPLGRWLRENAAPGSRLAAWDIGAIGYYSDLPLLDLYGLTDRRFATFAHQRATSEERLGALRENPPGYIAAYGENGHARASWLEGDGDWLHREYEEISYWPDSPSTGIVLLKRRQPASR